jgi:SAM-dependent methyltransferase
MGHRLGLLAALAEGPGTPAELAARTGLHERYVREWAGALVAGAVLDLDGERVVLPAAHAPFLVGGGPLDNAPQAALLRTLGALAPEVERSFADGGGVPHAAYAAHGRMGEHWRGIYDAHLVDGFLGAVPGVVERLRAGVRVLDVGCGTGHAVNLIAREFPASTVRGVDLSPAVIADAERERDAMGLPNAQFAVLDAATLPPSPPYDVITAFDAVHDQQRPAEVLRRIRSALAPGGLFLMVDVDVTGRPHADRALPHAPLAWAVSLLFCVPTTRAAGGEGLGAAWGRATALRMLAEAGFTDVEVLAPPSAS